MHAAIEQIDAETIVVPIEVPGAQVVLLQTFFELYEGLGAVRTVNIRESIICIVTTPTMLTPCLEALTSMKQLISWRFAEALPLHTKENLFDFNPQRKR